MRLNVVLKFDQILDYEKGSALAINNLQLLI